MNGIAFLSLHHTSKMEGLFEGAHYMMHTETKITEHFPAHLLSSYC